MNEDSLKVLGAVFETITQTAWTHLDHGDPVVVGSPAAQRRLHYAQVLQNIAAALPVVLAAYGEAGDEELAPLLPQRLRSTDPGADGADIDQRMLNLQLDWVDVLHPLEALGKWPPTMYSVGPWPPRTGSSPLEGSAVLQSIGPWPPK